MNDSSRRCNLSLAALLVTAAACGSDQGGALPSDTVTDTTTPDVSDDVLTDSTGEDIDSADVNAEPAEPFSAANSLPENDPRYAGEQLFLYETWGVGILSSLPPADFVAALPETNPEVFGNQFERFGFIPDSSNEFPIGLQRDPAHPDTVHETCGLCHVASLPDGRLWIGAPNEQLQWGAFRLAVEEAWIAAGNPPLYGELERQKMALLGPGRTNAESSSYPRLVPANFPVYWDLGLRNDLNYMGTGQNVKTEAYFALYTFGCGNPNEETAIVPFPDAEKLETFLAFLGGIEAPDAPAGEAEQVARGAEVFAEARCNTCHFVDDPEAEFVVPLDREPGAAERIPGDDPDWARGSIRTSAAHRILQDGDEEGSGGGSDRGFDDLIAFIISKGLSVRQTNGYRTNSLRGLWATAPYLHNGSVPTLEAMLQPASERPVTFTQGDYTVDTTVFGFSNEGHEFGVDLPDEDKQALLAYLRSL